MCVLSTTVHRSYYSAREYLHQRSPSQSPLVGVIECSVRAVPVTANLLFQQLSFPSEADSRYPFITFTLTHDVTVTLNTDYSRVRVPTRVYHWSTQLELTDASHREADAREQRERESRDARPNSEEPQV